MGVNGAARLIKKHGLVERTISHQDLLDEFSATRVLVDVFGSFFVLLRQYGIKNDFPGFARLMKQLFTGMTDVAFVVDGSRSAEKSATHADRDKTRSRAVEKFVRLVDELTPTSRVSSAKWKMLRKAQESGYRLSREIRCQLVAALEAEGLEVISAPHEADVEIARTDGSFLACSVDSDLLFHRKISLVARPRVIQQKIISWEIVPRTHVLNRLGITTGKHGAVCKHLIFFRSPGRVGDPSRKRLCPQHTRSRDNEEP